jgi:glycosyltransferase involved in cell wall biosynthesis
VHYWLEALNRCIAEGYPITGLVIGDGPEAEALKAQARKAEILAQVPYELGKVHFAGWKPQFEVAAVLAEQDCLVLPTLCECGGAVILEAMATELPVIATDWGGPADYVTAASGILICPETEEVFVSGLAEAMQRISSDAELRQKMGKSGRLEVERHYCWNSKINVIVKIYGEAIGRPDLQDEEIDQP